MTKVFCYAARDNWYIHRTVESHHSWKWYIQDSSSSLMVPKLMVFSNSLLPCFFSAEPFIHGFINIILLWKQNTKVYSPFQWLPNFFSSHFLNLVSTCHLCLAYQMVLSYFCNLTVQTRTSFPEINTFPGEFIHQERFTTSFQNTRRHSYLKTTGTLHVYA